MHGLACRDCRFWEKLPQLDHGRCRRNPPLDRNAQKFGEWPYTSPTDWCGAFEGADAGAAEARARGT